MNDEIKEILDYLKNDNIEKPFGMAIIDKHKLLDYITNLQESESYYYGQYKDYKSRCEKADKYIQNCPEYLWENVNTKVLLNIINGKAE